MINVELTTKKANGRTFSVIAKGISSPERAYLRKELKDLVDKNKRKAVHNLFFQNKGRNIYNAEDFKNICSLKETPEGFAIVFRPSEVRKISKKYLRGDMDIETAIESAPKQFDFTRGFFKNSVLSINDFFKENASSLKTKHHIDVYLKK